MAAALPLCDACASKSHVPVSRLQRVAVREQGPAFLYSCGSCGSLWIETLRYMAPISTAEAAAVFPDYESDR